MRLVERWRRVSTIFGALRATSHGPVQLAFQALRFRAFGWRASSGNCTMARPIILGVVGDLASGRTTITKGLVEILGRDNVTHIGIDDYHRYHRESGRSSGSRR
jgi:pantothenate kinase-related protein Tda10